MPASAGWPSAPCRSPRCSGSSSTAWACRCRGRCSSGSPRRRVATRSTRSRSRGCSPAVAPTARRRCRCRTTSARSSPAASRRCRRERATRCSTRPRSLGRVAAPSTRMRSPRRSARACHDCRRRSDLVHASTVRGRRLRSCVPGGAARGARTARRGGRRPRGARASPRARDQPLRIPTRRACSTRRRRARVRAAHRTAQPS